MSSRYNKRLNIFAQFLLPGNRFMAENLKRVNNFWIFSNLCILSD
jgi:hypothetical protein